MLASLSLAAQEPSLDKEVALGRVMAADLRKHATPLDNPAVQTYLDGLGQRLAAQMLDARSPFTFAAITGDYCSELGGPPGMPTAFPGGYLFVPAALFITAQDEAEFAGILAHSMEHKVRVVHGGGIPLIFISDCTGRASGLPRTPSHGPSRLRSGRVWCTTSSDFRSPVAISASHKCEQ